MKVLYKMKLKGTRTLVLALALICAIPFSSANAAPENAWVTPMGAGEWDYLGTDVFTYSSVTVQSGGGDFMVWLRGGPSGYYDLYEYDPDNADDYVGTVYLSPDAKVAFRNIGGFVDGDNNRAEFYLHKNFGGSATVSFYD